MADGDISDEKPDDEEDEEPEVWEDEKNEKSSKESFKASAGNKDNDLWKDNFGGDYGEGGPFLLPIGEEDVEYPPEWQEGELESEPSRSEVSVASIVTEAEETEEERTDRIEREQLIEIVKVKLGERILIRRRNIFLHKKLVEHFKKRRMEHVLKEDQKGFELENKYLKRLFAFQDFKQKQESEMDDLLSNLVKFNRETDELEEELNETLHKFIQRQKELSLNLVSSKTGKKLNEKTVDRLLRREENKCNEKGKLKLKFIKLKNLIEEKEKQLKVMENFGDGLYIMDYELLKTDNENYLDKIEEKEEELAKLRIKTTGNIQNLAQVREKVHAIEGDIQLTEARFNEVKLEFNITRERVGNAKRKRDALREEYTRLKMMSGLLSEDRLLRDFELNIDEKEKFKDINDEMKMLLKQKKKQQTELTLKLEKKSKRPGTFTYK